MQYTVDEDVDTRYGRPLADCYRNCNTKKGFVSIPYRNHKTRVRKGDTISLKLFTAAWIMTSLDGDDKAERVHEKSLRNLSFAERIVIFTRCINEAQPITNETTEEGKNIELCINRKKNRFMKNAGCERRLN